MPPFSDNPEEFADLGVEVEQAGFDGYFLWDHIVFTNSSEGPPILEDQDRDDGNAGAAPPAVAAG